MPRSSLPPPNSFMLCGCEEGVTTIAMRMVGDPVIFTVLMQQAGLGCGEQAQLSGNQDIVI